VDKWAPAGAHFLAQAQDVAGNSGRKANGMCFTAGKPCIDTRTGC